MNSWRLATTEDARVEVVLVGAAMQCLESGYDRTHFR